MKITAEQAISRICKEGHPIVEMHSEFQAEGLANMIKHSANERILFFWLTLPFTIPSINAGRAIPNKKPALKELKWWFFVLFPTRRRFIAFFLLPRTIFQVMKCRHSSQCFSVATRTKSRGIHVLHVRHHLTDRGIGGKCTFFNLKTDIKYFKTHLQRFSCVLFPSCTAAVPVSVSGVRNNGLA